MTVGSLFSGIGGLELGLERAGMETIWQVEKNDFCKQILDKHWPEVPTYGDITDIDFRELERPDVICGGFPCQDLSYAGKGKGLDGERSGLWWEMYRSISEIRPRYIVVENVAALVRRGLDVVCGSLSEIGYDAEWEIISACMFGAPHPRERLFLVAYPDSLPRTLRVFAWDSQESVQRVSSQREWGKDWYELEMAPRPTSRARSDGTVLPEPNIPRMADGTSKELDRIRATGNAVVPQVAEFVGRCVMRHHKKSTT